MRALKILASVLIGALPAALLAASGFTAINGSDLDSVFAAYHSGWPQASATNYITSDGKDLNQRYAPLSTGSAAAATGFYIAGGADLNTVFAAAGTTGVQIATQPSSVSGSTAAGNPSGSVTSNSTSCSGTKGGGSYGYTWVFASGSGASFTAGTSSSTAVTGTVNAGATNSGTMYCQVSDGVTSANSNTVGWSLTNTTPAAHAFSITASSESFEIGYSGGFGSITGGTFNGLTIYGLFDVTTSSMSVFQVSGYTSNPGQSAFSSLTCNGHTYTMAGASSYNYSGGVAAWSWSSKFGFTSGDTYPCTLNF